MQALVKLCNKSLAAGQERPLLALVYAAWARLVGRVAVGPKQPALSHIESFFAHPALAIP